MNKPFSKKILMIENFIFACGLLIIFILLTALIFSDSSDMVEQVSDAALYIIPSLSY